MSNSRSAEGEHELLGGDVAILVVVEVAEGRLVLVHVLGLERQLGLGLLLGEGAAAEDAGRAAQQTGDTAPWTSCIATSRYVDMCRYEQILMIDIYTWHWYIGGRFDILYITFGVILVTRVWFRGG